jgi:putative ABC transport system substrate-binding protein
LDVRYLEKGQGRWAAPGPAGTRSHTRLALFLPPVLPRVLLPLVLLLALSSRATSAAGAQADPTVRVAIILSQQLAPYEEAATGIEDGLAGLPLDVSVDVYQLEDHSGDQERIAAQLRDRGTALLFTVGTEAYRAFAPRINDIPLIITMVYDPRSEFALDPATAPNVYAACLRVPYEQQLAIFKQYLPAVKKVAVLCMSGSESSVSRELKSAPKGLGLEIVPIVLTDLKDLERALARAQSEAEAFLMILDKSIYTTATTPKILLSCARSQIPVWSFSPNYVKAGALISVSSSYRQNGMTAAALAGDILTGRPVAQRYVPTSGVLIAWNEHVAQALGIDLPASRRDKCDLVY